MAIRRQIFVSALSDDLDWISGLVENFDVGVEINDFALYSNLAGTVERSFELWHLWSGAATSRVPLIMHAPFLNLIPGSMEPEVVELTRKRHEEALNIAGILDVGALVFHSGYNPLVRGPHYFEPWLSSTARYFRELLDKFPQLVFLIENMWEPDLKPLMELIDSVGDPRFKACLDIGHASIYSPLSPDEWVSKLGLRLGHVHLNDNDGDWDQEYPLGRGKVPIDRVLTNLDQMGFAGGVTVKVRGKQSVMKSFEYLSTHRIFLPKR